MTLTGNAMVAGVIGYPVAHSLSPRLHGYWLEKYNIDGAYIPMAVKPEYLPSALAALPRLGIRGVNLTVPHKEMALRLMHTLDDDARRTGAVNTVVVEGDELHGRNTDVYGFAENLRRGAPGWNAAAGKAVVLGAGGAARAVCVALLDMGALEVVVVNRTWAKAEALAEDIGGAITVADWDARHELLDGASVLVNTTTLGMVGQPALYLDMQKLPPETLVTDIVYAPLQTELLKQSAARGNPVVDGFGMLLYQAVPGFEAWFGKTPEVTDTLRNTVLKAKAA